MTHAKLAVEEHGRVTADYIDYNRRDVLATEELLVTLREIDQLGLKLHQRAPFPPRPLPRPICARSDTAAPDESAEHFSGCASRPLCDRFHGGRAECRIRRAPVPVVTVDFRSMYPTRELFARPVAHRHWPAHCCLECTEEFWALVASASLDAAFNPATWPRLCCFVEIEPDGDILPVRGKYSETREG